MEDTVYRSMVRWPGTKEVLKFRLARKRKCGPMEIKAERGKRGGEWYLLLQVPAGR